MALLSFLGKKPKNTYSSIVKLDDNTALSATLRYLTDGVGNALPIKVSTTNVEMNAGVGIGGAPSTAALHVYIYGRFI